MPRSREFCRTTPSRETWCCWSTEGVRGLSHPTLDTNNTHTTVPSFSHGHFIFLALSPCLSFSAGSHSLVSPNLYKSPSSPPGPPGPPGPSGHASSDMPSSASDALLTPQPHPNPNLHPPGSLAPPTPAADPPSLVQSTSFLDSVPVTLTLEPRDWQGVEESARGPPPSRSSSLGAVAKGQVDSRGGPKTLEVELRRRPGEGFGFVIASQDVANGGESSSDVFLSEFVGQSVPEIHLRRSFLLLSLHLDHAGMKSWCWSIL